MAEHNRLGLVGEQEACLYLIERDIRIVERNWRGQDGEIDIIADDYGEIVFIEVKTRGASEQSLPEYAVDAYRMYRLSRAAEEFLWRHDMAQRPYRFDIIALEGTEPPFCLRHIVDAFPMQPRKAQPGPLGL